MTEDVYVVAIAALLPLTACMLVFQANPYHALVIRGILGAVAALVYALFGAADVALTEALVGTMLSITLYAVAVRSSMSMRLGVLEQESNETLKADVENIENAPVMDTGDAPVAIAKTPDPDHPSEPLFAALRQTLSKYHMRLEVVPYSNLQALQTALMAKEIHTISVLSESDLSESEIDPESPPADRQLFYQIQTRIQRLYDILQAELPSTLATLTCVNPNKT